MKRFAWLSVLILAFALPAVAGNFTDDMHFYKWAEFRSFLEFKEITAPGNPATNKGRLYVADDGGTTTLYFKDSAGTATSLMAGSNGVFTAGATITGAAVNLNASSNFAVNVGTGTSTGTVTIGGAANQSIAIGNGAAVKTVALGSSNTTSTTTILSGSGGILLNASNNQPVNIGTGTSTGTVTVGGAGAQTIAIGDGAAVKTVSLGSSNTTSTTTINAGSGKINLVGDVAGNGASAFSGMLATVDNDADGEAGGDITVAMSGNVFTNVGAVGAGAWTLPGAAAGIHYCFIVMAAQELRVTPAAGDVINIAGSAGDAAEYWTANAVGESLCLMAVDATNWIATSYTGTWTQATP